MNVAEANNRGLNFAIAAFAGALAVALATAIPTEDELLHKADETIIPLVFVGLLIWYFTGRRKYSRSLVPLGTIALALVLKLIWLAIEFNDKEDRGNDIGIAILLVSFLAITAYAYFRPPANA
jgi:hypothetical protein